MTQKFLCFLLLLASPLLLHAQISMKISTPHTRYLSYENIPVTLTMRNYSGNTLIFSMENAGKLSFNIRTRSGRILSLLDRNANPMQNLIFAPGESKTLEITLNRLFDLQRAEFYNVTACIEHRRMPQLYVSNEISFEVQQGIILSSKTIGLPTSDSAESIHSVTASLIRFNDGTDELYCLRLDDDEQVYGTFRIGPFMNGTPPQMDADSTSAIHILVQLRPRLYAYNVYAVINGEAKIRQQRLYVPEGGTPRLSRSSGFLKVLYARQAVEGKDFNFQKKE